MRWSYLVTETVKEETMNPFEQIDRRNDEYERVRELQNADFECPHCGSKPSGHYVVCPLITGKPVGAYVETFVVTKPLDSTYQPTETDRIMLHGLGVQW